MKTLILTLFIALTISICALKGNEVLATGDPEIVRINFTKFDTAGWTYAGIVKSNGESYRKVFVQEFDTVYMYPAKRKYVFKAFHVTSDKGRLIFDNIRTKFETQETMDTQYDVTWRYYSYKIRFVWDDDKITVTTWL